MSPNVLIVQKKNNQKKIMLVNIPITRIPEQEIPLLTHLKLLVSPRTQGGLQSPFVPSAKIQHSEGSVKAVISYTLKSTQLRFNNIYKNLIKVYKILTVL